jgi:Spy/CpxP family protein refolding chaperone
VEAAAAPVARARKENVMFGFFIGSVCLVLLFAHLRRRHYYAAYGPWGDDGGYGYGGSCGRGYGGFGFGRGMWGRGRRGGHRRMIARHLMTRLDTTPGQEKAIRSAVETLRSSFGDGREELQSVRRDLAQAFGSDALDEQALSAAVSKQEAFVNRTRGELVQAIRNVHEALDPRQRRQVSEWIASGFSRRHDRDDDWM